MNTSDTSYNSYIGGLVGYGSGSVQTCDNSGKIQVINPKGYTCIGGLIAVRRIYNNKS